MGESQVVQGVEGAGVLLAEEVAVGRVEPAVELQCLVVAGEPPQVGAQPVDRPQVVQVAFAAFLAQVVGRLALQGLGAHVVAGGAQQVGVVVDEFVDPRVMLAEGGPPGVQGALAEFHPRGVLADEVHVAQAVEHQALDLGVLAVQDVRVLEVRHDLGVRVPQAGVGGTAGVGGREGAPDHVDELPTVRLRHVLADDLVDHAVQVEGLAGGRARLARRLVGLQAHHRVLA
ncbi:hypothetical protein GCM10010335_41820 [Streptomyces galbus]|nr:hypothetical protein GCM10010335_41820 [Streptomyces galbus]